MNASLYALSLTAAAVPAPEATEIASAVVSPAQETVATPLSLSAPENSPDRHPPSEPAPEYPKLSIGGEYRLRGEYVRNPDFGLDVGEDQALLSRLLVRADLKLNRSLRFHVEFGSYLAWGRERGDGPTDEDRLDLMQGYVELTAPSGPGEAQLRVGRQQVVLGSARLVSIRESPNARRAFDGVRGSWSDGGTRFDAFFLRPVMLERGAFDDATNDGEKLYGAHLTVPALPSLGLSADLYYLGYRRERASFADGMGTEQRHSVGMRVFGKRSAFDWDLEAIYQFGQHGDRDISAWAVAADIGYRLDQLPWRPRLGMKADIASGDKKKGDGKLGTFNALYPKLPYFTEAAMVAPSNIMDLHPTLKLAPSPVLSLTVGANWLWRHRRADAYYMPPLQPLVTPPGNSRYLGVQGEISAEWKALPNVSIAAWYVHFAPSDAIEREGGRGVDYFAGSITWKF